MQLKGLRGRGRGIARDTGWTGANEVVTLLTGLVILQVLIVGLGPASYGRYAAVAALAAILTTLSSVWVVMLLLQLTLRDGAPVQQAYSIALGLALITSVVGLALGLPLGHVLIPDLTLPVIAAFLIADLVGGIFFMVTGAAVQAVHGLAPATRVRLLAVITRFVVVVGVGVSGQASLPLLGACLVIGNAGVGLLVFIFVTRRLQLPRVPAWPRLASVRMGLPYAGVLVAASVQEDSDKIFLARLADPVDAGLYAAAYRVVQLGLIPAKALLASSHPRFLKNTPGESREHLRRAVRFTVPTAAYGLAASAGVVLLGPLVPKVFGSDYAEILPLLIGLAPLIVLRTLNVFPPNALLGLGRYGLRFYAILGVTVLNLLLNAVLISALSTTGAVIATLSTEAVLILVLWRCLVVAQRQHDDGSAARTGRA